MNPPMARAMRSQEGYLIFGAYPASGAAAAEASLQGCRGEPWQSARCRPGIQDVGREVLPRRPARPTPAPGRVLVPASRLGTVLDYLRSGPSELAVLGSVARDGSALLLTFASSGEVGRLQSLSAGDESALVGIARSFGGDLYHTVLKQRAELAP